MKISDIDVESRVDELLLSQYQGSQNLKDYIKCFVKPTQDNFTALNAMMLSRKIDEATGYSLDKIAKTVGEQRILRGSAALGFFGFDGEADALPLNEGIFFSYGDAKTGDLVLTDQSLRRLVRARILQNTSGGKVEDVISYIELIVGKTLDIEIVEGSASVAITIKDTLGIQDKLLLSIRLYNILPIGVKATLQDLGGVINLEVLNV